MQSCHTVLSAQSDIAIFKTHQAFYRAILLTSASKIFILVLLLCEDLHFSGEKSERFAIALTFL
jgi:hypothetical protein